jgi:hypothetical protein
VDSTGATIDFLLSAKRDVAAAWQDPEVPARSATTKQTQALWQNSST